MSFSRGPEGGMILNSDTKFSDSGCSVCAVDFLNEWINEWKTEWMTEWMNSRRRKDREGKHNVLSHISKCDFIFRNICSLPIQLPLKLPLWELFKTHCIFSIEIFMNIVVNSHAVVRNNAERASMPFTQFPWKVVVLHKYSRAS